jgi:hypothetical protein
MGHCEIVVGISFTTFCDGSDVICWDERNRALPRRVEYLVQELHCTNY